MKKSHKAERKRMEHKMNIGATLCCLAVLLFTLVPGTLPAQDGSNAGRQNGKAAPESSNSNMGQEQPTILGSAAVRTRYKINGLVGFATGDMDRQLVDQANGAGFEVEFRTNTRLRPVVEANFLYGEGRRIRPGLRYQDMEFYSLSTGVNFFPARNAEGFYTTLLWGANVARPNSKMLYGNDTWGYYYFPNNRNFDGFGITAGMGALMFKRVDVSIRYQALLSHTYRDHIGVRQDNGAQGWMTIRMGIVLGGGVAKAKGAHVPMTTAHTARVPGGAKGEVLRLNGVVDSLQGALQTREARATVLQKQADDTQRMVEEQASDIVILSGALEELRNASQNAPTQPAVAMRVVQESPGGFGALAVYTVLHPFSETTSLDTFRVVTTVLSDGGLRHDLQIRTVRGQRYAEELFALPLADAPQPSASKDVELELLRVRMALSPEAFLEFPVSANALQRSENRAMLDLPFDLSEQDFRTLFEERPFVGFRFQSDPETLRTLVFSKKLRRIVNIEP